MTVADRVGAARRHRASGSGLGLPIAQALAQAHGGSLALFSPQLPGDGGGAGTRAVLRLPLRSETVVPADEALEA